MSDAPAADRALLVGGEGPLGFAVPMEDVGRLVAASELPSPHRRTTVPRLFQGAAPGPEPADARYAEVPGAAPPTFLGLSSRLRVERVPADAIQPIPPVLATTARRWGWTGLLRSGETWLVLLDVALLAALAAPRRPA